MTDKTAKTEDAPKVKIIHPDLFVCKTSAITADGNITVGQIAEAGAEILKTHAHLFRALEVTYRA